MAISVTWGPRALLTVCVLLAAISASTQQKRAIDCRRFVFAPICRGVAAKRSDPAYGMGLARFLHTFHQQQRFPVAASAGAEVGGVQNAAATTSPELRELAVAVSKHQSDEQDAPLNRDTMYHVYMPRLPAPRPEYEY